MGEWYTAVSYPADGPMTDAQLDALMDAIPEFSTAAHNPGTGLLRLAFQVQAEDEQAARARAASTASEVVASVLGEAAEPVGVEIQPIPAVELQDSEQADQPEPAEEPVG